MDGARPSGVFRSPFTGFILMVGHALRMTVARRSAGAAIVGVPGVLPAFGLARREVRAPKVDRHPTAGFFTMKAAMRAHQSFAVIAFCTFPGGCLREATI